MRQILLSTLIVLALPSACSPAAQASDFATTATALAAEVMEQVAQTQVAPPSLPANTPLPLPTTMPAVIPVTPLVTGAYLMAYHACDNSKSDCHNPQNHRVYLAQSDDGVTWSLVPGWVPYSGSVPDVIRRRNTLYIYSAGQNSLVRYHLDTNTMDAPAQATITGGQMFVDPSLFVDEQGRLVLFFLYGQMGGDPAGCMPGDTSCVRNIGSATEVQGSDGTQFTLDDGQRISVTLGPSAAYRSASDPDIFYDGKQYVLYLSHGPSISVWASADLHGSYSLVTTLPNGMLTSGTGGVPSGYFDPTSGQYWTYVHVDKNNRTIIRRAVHDNLGRGLLENDWVTVITGESIGIGESFSVASPGFAVNEP